MARLPWYVKYLLVPVFCWPVMALGEPMAQLIQGDVRIVVYTEDCTLKSVVANLPKRATWTEKGKTYEGCAGSNPEIGVLMFYFKEDKSVAAVPMQAFSKVTSI